MSAKRFCRHLHRDERGAALLTFTLMFLVLLGFAAMVVDAGLAYYNRRLIQNAADAAALAGARYLPDDPDKAVQVAQDYLDLNGAGGDDTQVVPSNSYSFGQTTMTFDVPVALTVTIHRDFDVGLRYVVGAGHTEIAATATAIVSSVEPNDLWPWGVTNNSLNCPAEIGSECILHVGPHGSEGGNFRSLCFEDNECGQQNYVDNIASGWDGAVPTPNPGPPPPWNWPVLTEPGNMPQQAMNELNRLFDLDAQQKCDDGVNSCAGSYGLDSEYDEDSISDCVHDTRCTRVGVIPLIRESWEQLEAQEDINGRATVHVDDFACFFLTERPTQDQGTLLIYGVFIEHCRDVGRAPTYGLDGPLSVYLWK